MTVVSKLPNLYHLVYVFFRICILPRFPLREFTITMKDEWHVVCSITVSNRAGKRTVFLTKK